MISRNREAEAYTAFKATRAESTDAILSDDHAMHTEFHLLGAQIKHEVENAVSFIDLLKHKTLRKRCCIGFLIMFAAQATGTTTINSE